LVAAAGAYKKLVERQLVTMAQEQSEVEAQIKEKNERKLSL